MKKLAVKEVLNKMKKEGAYIVYGDCFTLNSGYRVYDHIGDLLGFIDCRQFEKLKNDITVKARHFSSVEYIPTERKRKMELTSDEKRTVKAVFSELLKKPYSELNCFIGSLTIKEMQKLYSKLRYEEYCDERGINYEDMTEDDFISAEEMANKDYSDSDDE